MTDDDRTQEIRRDADRYRPATEEIHNTGAPARERSGNTPPFGAPAAPQQRPHQAGGYQQPQQPPPVRQPAPGYRPAPEQPPYGKPMLPTDRGSGGFPAALVGAVVAALLTVVTSYGRYQENLHGVRTDASSFLGWINGYMGLVAWPFGDGRNSGDQVTAFIAGLVIVLVVTLLLTMASVMPTRPGNAGFSVFLSGWTATVVAGAIAEPVSAAIWMPSEMLDDYVMNYVTSGIVWGFIYGWIVGLALLVGHSMRRKPAAR